MTDLRTVAALYIDPRGPYPHLHGVESWGLPWRDARRYDGPYPIVAHPPCGPWGLSRHRSRTQDPACAIRAVAQVRRWGGVLEHPKGSKLFAALCLPRPGESDAHGFTIEVAQVSWGHVARKATWLYLVGIDRASALAGVRSGGTPTHWASGGRVHSSAAGAHSSAVPAGIKVCSAEQRRRTPPAFAAWLVSLARASRSEVAA